MPSNSRAPQPPSPDTDPTGTMTIGELSDITGLSPSAIRFYERRGVLPARTAGSGWQRYEHDALQRLALIQLAKGAGFSLDETIRFLDAVDADPDSVPGSAPVWHGLAEAKLVEVETQIGRLRHMCRLLQDALTYSYLPPDRLRQVPAMLGWTAALPEDASGLPGAVSIPRSTGDLQPYGDRAAGPDGGDRAGSRVTG